jgi:hypothetical protein
VLGQAAYFLEALAYWLVLPAASMVGSINRRVQRIFFAVSGPIRILPCLSDLKGALQRSLRFAYAWRKRCYCDHDRQLFPCQKRCGGFWPARFSLVVLAPRFISLSARSFGRGIAAEHTVFGREGWGQRLDRLEAQVTIITYSLTGSSPLSFQPPLYPSSRLPLQYFYTQTNTPPPSSSAPPHSPP